MPEITNQQRDAAFDNASAEQQFLYESPESGELLWQIATKHDLTESKKYTNFALAVGDVILGIKKQTDLPALLSQRVDISFERAIKITGDIIDFLNTSLQPEGSTIAVETTTDTDKESLESDIAETEAALNAIPRIRTMAQDAHKQESPTHTTSQSDLLNKENRWAPKK